jgi:flagellar biosynthesis/type III secretory pathway chaperone
MNPVEAVKNVLEEQVQGCCQLLALLQREKVCLSDLQMEGVEAITKEKDILVLKLTLLEEERKRLLGRLVHENFLGQDLKEQDFRKLNLLHLAELTGETIFKELRSKLVSLSQSIKELNDLNKIMIDRTLGFLRRNNQFLGMFYPGTASIGGKGERLSREM